MEIDLQRLQQENEKLRETMRDMVEDYTRQLELRDETIKRFEQDNFHAIDSYKAEASTLRDRVAQLTRELDMTSGNAGRESQLRGEIEHLKTQLHDKDRFIDQQINNHKSEWAEIYANQKRDLEDI